MKILNHLKTRLRTTKNVAKLALTGLLFCIPFTASHACSVHNHGCIYHGFNATVNTSYPTTNTDTSVVLYSIGKTPNTGTPSNVDFDNKVWIPELTGVKDASGNYTTPTGAYILNNTAYGTTHPPADTYAPDDRYRLVYPSQYQITFNQNSAVAKHTGDFNGAENGNIPNATGCPNMPNAANCEAVVVTGNVPTGFYDQQVRIFNSTGNPNPAVDLQVGVYTTGKARLVTPSHIDNGNETADFQSISGTGATTPLYRYEIVNTGYDPHAGGVAWFDRNRTYTTGYGKPYTSGSHIYQNRFDTTDTTRTKIYKYGAGEQSLQARNFSTKHLYLGEVAPPPPPPPPPAEVKASCVQTSFGCFSNEFLGSLKNTMTMPQNMLKACIGINCLIENQVLNYNLRASNAKTEGIVFDQGGFKLKDVAFEFSDKFSESTIPIRIASDWTIRTPTGNGRIFYGNQYVSTVKLTSIMKPVAVVGNVVQVAEQYGQIKQAYILDGNQFGDNTITQTKGAVGAVVVGGAGGWVGGAMGGAIGGLWCGPGAPICSGVSAVVGGVIGGTIGSNEGEYFFENTTTVYKNKRNHKK